MKNTELVKKKRSGKWASQPYLHTHTHHTLNSSPSYLNRWDCHSVPVSHSLEYWNVKGAGGDEGAAAEACRRSTTAARITELERVIIEETTCLSYCCAQKSFFLLSFYFYVLLLVWNTPASFTFGISKTINALNPFANQSGGQNPFSAVPFQISGSPGRDQIFVFQPECGRNIQHLELLIQKGFAQAGDYLPDTFRTIVEMTRKSAEAHSCWCSSVVMDL